ncbi:MULTISPECIES: ABC transporter transmembrane domain-containing protein [unclassified Rhodanobacter]|uniref:ABC transporter transmembrane domain-containing protein n=1 Tax=unclassified Rhodanobacter TaxID=2621553 RepID=UPI001BE0C03E|nr:MULTISPECIES: ABC transporter transmembrane domain-containing protein [unclassified Rhodanobacter]MBT2145109.1 ATP-binding cassette domain-containing protein [Rhodanobacter sp. LX-99]MBT2149154.1 ATP-binding cassette domain-containing protein [Rhodanobacter sp. LX-100]
MSDAATSRPVRRIGALRELWPFLKPHRALALGWLLFLALSSGASLALPMAFRHIIDQGFGHSSQAVINQTFIVLFGVALVLAFATAARYFCITLLSERALAALRQTLYAHVIRLDVGFFEKSRVGELLSRLSADTEVVQALIGSGVSVALRSAVMLVGAAVAMVWTAPSLAGLTALVIPAVMLPILLFGRRVQKLSRASQDRLADAAAIANETLNASTAVKAYARERIESTRYGSAIARALATARRRIGMRSLLTMAVIVLVFGAITLVLWAGARHVLAGTLGAGVLGQFVLYAVFAAGSVAGLSEVWGDVLRAAGAMERIGELLGERADIVDPAQPQALPQPMRGELRFDGVTFHYPTRPDAAALHDFTLTIRPGETVALVGPSGAGKSTVFALLLRFYDPQSGSIRIDGIDLRDTTLAGLRGAIALVPQETVIFAGSAADNIRFGRQDAGDDEVREAARAAEAHEFISALEHGYDAELGERGVRLSGGQRQRIAIARAILRDAPLLLLDEATSALDAQSEAAIQQALARLEQGRTTLVIAHRLATVQRADRIVVMDGGRIVAQGTHESLLAEGGLYAELARLQFVA